MRVIDFILIKEECKYKIKKTSDWTLDTFQDLKNLNIVQQAIPSNQIKLYGNEGKMLPYLINEERHGQLSEMAIEILDGGDNFFNESE